MTYNKLVRDKIPDLIQAQGERAVYRVLDSREYALELERKLDEEVGEFHKDKTIEELVDILEVVHALARNLGYTSDELIGAYREKNQERGGFDRRIFLLSKEG